MEKKPSGKSVSTILAETYADIFMDRLKNINADNWQKPWITAHACPAQNISGNIYSGFNQFFLSIISSMKGWEHPLFLTDKQCDRLGVLINKGEHSFPIACVKTWYKDESDQKRPTINPKAYDALDEEAKKGNVRKESLLYYKGYNISQTNFKDIRPEKMAQIEDQYKAVVNTTRDVLVPAIDKMIADQSWVCKINEQQSDQAYFSRREDSIVIPKREQFPDRGVFYGTLYHEMTYSTGVESRLNREMRGFFGSMDYAREELVAELSSAILCTKSELDVSISEHNLQYLKSWMEVLSEDPKAITQVVADASKAVDFISEKAKLDQRPTIDLSDIGKELKEAQEHTESQAENRHTSIRR